MSARSVGAPCFDVALPLDQEGRISGHADADRRLLRLAVRQASVFTAAQARSCGLTPSAIRSRLDRGLWLPLHRGVFVFAAVEETWKQRAWGAVLACAPGAVAGYHTAGEAWGFVEGFDRPQIFVPQSRVVERPGIEVHRTRRLDRVTLDGLPVTSPMRTVLDLASCLDDLDLERLIDHAHRRRSIDLVRFNAFLDDDFARARPASGRLRELVRQRDPSRPIGSHLESALFAALRRAGLPQPIPQYPVETRKGLRRIDFAFPEQRLAIEADGFAPHGTREAFEEDRVRQNEIEELGWHFRRVTDRQLKRDPSEVVVTIGIALGMRPVRWR